MSVCGSADPPGHLGCMESWRLYEKLLCTHICQIVKVTTLHGPNGGRQPN